ncbi:hypothetical protein DPEC_G00155960 [Dallia pectoralis]|uniref:Uncharacterized protein n=1 Tax=Dallia pectoralis TaxID=75939 RepID=A0ACC2GKL8_DALPE|nr:hypothetical protein DPEC_G00155960 [Dallia pectoralis]
MDEDIRAADGITEEQIEEMHQNIQRFMSDTQASVMRLKEISGFLFARDAEKRKKLENALHKGGVWCWWWEPKDDARTILKIHELQPPSASMFLMDPSLANKSSFDLSFMCRIIVKGDLQHISWFHESAAEVSISSQGYCDNLLGFYQLRETCMKTVTQV